MPLSTSLRSDNTSLRVMFMHTLYHSYIHMYMYIIYMHLMKLLHMYTHVYATCTILHVCNCTDVHVCMYKNKTHLRMFFS